MPCGKPDSMRRSWKRLPNEYWTAFGLLDRFQFQTRCVREKRLHMARGRGHLPLTYRTFAPFYVLGPLSRSNLHGKCGRAEK